MGFNFEDDFKSQKKGILILPKALRNKTGIKEDSDVLVEVRGDSIVLKPLEPKIVDVDPRIINRVVEEEKSEWDKKLKRTLRIALPDCFVIASAKKIGGAALFKKVEEEMRPVFKELRKHNVLFAQEMLGQRQALSK